MAAPSQLMLLLLSWASTALSVFHDPTAYSASTRVVSPRLLSVFETYQGCVNSTLLEEAVDVYYVDLEEAIIMNGWESREEACYRLCLSKEPFSERLSLASSRGNSTDSCGCHLTEEVDGLETVGDAFCMEGGWGAALYCGPDDRLCYNAAHHIAGDMTSLLLVVGGVLWARKCGILK